ncbi:MAG: site-specific integrase [Acidobacteria bacterium]|nr:site-specific integrase [Acidobacteriota bacterium]
MVKVEAPPIAEAVDKFLADARARHLGWESIRKYESFLQRRLLAWCDTRGLRLLKRLDIDNVRAFRNTWKDGPVYASKNLERLRAFLRFCRDSRWINDNPALALKLPKVADVPTLPFTAGEMKKILGACGKYRGDKDRMRAFVLTMRYSGLRIGDTATLKRDRLQANKILLYQAKTGTPVYVPIPKLVVDALEKLKNGSEYFFWQTGRGTVRTITSNWERYLSSVFDLSGVPGAHSHRFRDTFAVELLLAGVPIEQVSMLLGHSSMRITERHYAPWVKARQHQLEVAVRKAWRSAASSA